jgi:hypothetical protein
MSGKNAYGDTKTKTFWERIYGEISLNWKMEAAISVETLSILKIIPTFDR